MPCITCFVEDVSCPLEESSNRQHQHIYILSSSWACWHTENLPRERKHIVCITSLITIPNIDIWNVYIILLVIDTRRNGLLTFERVQEDSAWWPEPLEMRRRKRLNAPACIHTPGANYIQILVQYKPIECGVLTVHAKAVRFRIPHRDFHYQIRNALKIVILLKCQSQSFGLAHCRVTSAARFRRVVQQPDSDVRH